LSEASCPELVEGSVVEWFFSLPPRVEYAVLCGGLDQVHLNFDIVSTIRCPVEDLDAYPEQGRRI